MNNMPHPLAMVCDVNTIILEHVNAYANSHVHFSDFTKIFALAYMYVCMYVNICPRIRIDYL
jgi:hypothetical protein